MSLGILEARNKGRPIRGLSGEPPPDSWCWNYPGFKDCHGRNFKKCEAEQKDRELFKQKPMMTKAEFDDCVYRYDNINCDCPANDPRSSGSAPASPVLSAGLVFGSATPSAKVSELQTAINVAFRAHGMAPIGVDGKLGAGTCGAARYSDKSFGTSLQSKYGLVTACKSYKDPVPTPPVVTRPSSAAIAPDAFVSPQEQGLLSGKNGLIVLGVAGVAAYLLFGDKLKKKAS